MFIYMSQCVPQPVHLTRPVLFSIYPSHSTCAFLCLSISLDLCLSQFVHLIRPVPFSVCPSHSTCAFLRLSISLDLCLSPSVHLTRPVPFSVCPSHSTCAFLCLSISLDLCLSPSVHLTQPVPFSVCPSHLTGAFLHLPLPWKKLRDLYFLKKHKQIKNGYLRFTQADLITGQTELTTCRCCLKPYTWPVLTNQIWWNYLFYICCIVACTSLLLVSRKYKRCMSL